MTMFAALQSLGSIGAAITEDLLPQALLADEQKQSGQEDENDDDAKKDEGESKDSDNEEGGEERSEEEDAGGEEEEPEDPKPDIEEECTNTVCTGAKHHFDECVARVTGATEEHHKEDCVEEFFHLKHCVDTCTAPKLFAKLR